LRDALKTVQNDCMRTASNHEASVEGRAEELKVIATAKKVLQESVSLLQGPPVADDDDSDDQPPASLVQTASSSRRSLLRARSNHARERVAELIKKLSKEQHSSALAQLASRVSAVAEFGEANGEDPFVKIKGLIKEMIAKIQKQAEDAAQEKAYCDEQMSKTEEKKGDLETNVAKVTADIDTKVAQASDLKKQVVELQAELALLAKEKSEMDKVRASEKAAYEANKAELEKGLYGVKKALKILRKYYGAKEDGAVLAQTGADQPAKPATFKKSEGAGGSIMDILEVVEADLAKNLAEVEQEESDVQDAFDDRTQEIKIETASKMQDVKYKTQEAKGLDQAVNDLSETRESTQEELDAVLEYYGKVKERCVAKPETYEERKKRRAAEIKGLKEAMQILSEEAALIQGQLRAGRRTSSSTLAADR